MRRVEALAVSEKGHAHTCRVSEASMDVRLRRIIMAGEYLAKHYPELPRL